jgi:gamma-glutamyltranspeptidase
MPPADAVTARRFATEHHQDSFDPNPDRQEAFIEAGSLTVNAGLDQETQAALARRGHTVRVKDGPIANPVMLYVDQENGQLYAAGDPAARRHAAALNTK